MKKFFFLLTILLAFSFGTRVMAQLSDIVVFNAHLEDVLIIDVYYGEIQEITFDEADDYTNGVTEAGLEIDPGYSDVSVESTGNWNMTIQCPDFTGGGYTIPINNLGVWIENFGSFVNGNQVEWTCDEADAAQALNTANLPIISNLGGNAGDVGENNYRFHWLMGTMQGNMNPTSMFDQLQANLFELGDYTTTATLTVAPTP
jgi:hypothetical protein